MPHLKSRSSRNRIEDCGAFKSLLVDDDPAIRQILSLLLEDEGYSVLTAADGTREAIEFAQTTMFDLALLDFNMPVSDHWETLNQLSIKNPTASDHF